MAATMVGTSNRTFARDLGASAPVGPGTTSPPQVLTPRINFSAGGMLPNRQPMNVSADWPKKPEVAAHFRCWVSDTAVLPGTLYTRDSIAYILPNGTAQMTCTFLDTQPPAHTLTMPIAWCILPFGGRASWTYENTLVVRPNGTATVTCRHRPGV